MKAVSAACADLSQAHRTHNISFRTRQAGEKQGAFCSCVQQRAPCVPLAQCRMAYSRMHASLFARLVYWWGRYTAPIVLFCAVDVFLNTRYMKTGDRRLECLFAGFYWRRPACGNMHKHQQMRARTHTDAHTHSLSNTHTHKDMRLCTQQNSHAHTSHTHVFHLHARASRISR